MEIALLSFNMFPGFAPNNTADRGLLNAEAVSDFVLRDAGCFVEPPYLLNLIGVKFRHAISLAWRPRVPVAALCRHVLIIVVPRAEKKVIWIDAKWIVALMKDTEIGRDRTPDKGPCHAVRVFWSEIQRKLTIPSALHRSGLPLPTLIDFFHIHLPPKAGEYFHKGFLDHRILLSALCVNYNVHCRIIQEKLIV